MTLSSSRRRLYGAVDVFPFFASCWIVCRPASRRHCLDDEARVTLDNKPSLYHVDIPRMSTYKYVSQNGTLTRLETSSNVHDVCRPGGVVFG